MLMQMMDFIYDGIGVCVCVCVHMCLCVSHLYSSIDGHFCCFHILAIDNAAVNGACIFWN